MARKQDSQPGAHIMFGAIGVACPPFMAMASVWWAGGFLGFMLILGIVVFGHDDSALGKLRVALAGVLLGGAFGWLFLVMPAAVYLAPLPFMLAVSWLREYDQNNGTWDGQDVPNLHNMWIGCGIGQALQLLVMAI